MAKNQFSEPESYDHEIVDGDGKKIGELRIKPNGVMWKKKGAHTYKAVTLEQFATWIDANGTDKEK